MWKRVRIIGRDFLLYHQQCFPPDDEDDNADDDYDIDQQFESPFTIHERDIGVPSN